MTRRAACGGVFLFAAAALALRPLAVFWNANANYAYGWGVPFLAAYLLFERWQCRPDPIPPRTNPRAAWGLATVGAAWAVVFLAARLVTETEPASRPLLWIDASLAVTAWLAWFGLLGGRPWLRHFAFPVLFLLVSVPWIFRFEFIVTQGLMRFERRVGRRHAGPAGRSRPRRRKHDRPGDGPVRCDRRVQRHSFAAGVADDGPVLRRVLSLRCTRTRRAAGRGRGLALLGNYARMLFLAWRGAREGVASVEASHDSAGFFILGFTVVSLWLICLATRRSGPGPRIHTAENSRTSAAARRALGRRHFSGDAFRGGGHPALVRLARKLRAAFPDWTVAWPRAADSFRTTPLPAAAHDELHEDASSAAQWRGAEGWRWSGLWIRYHADAAGKVVFESHNPALCLPAAGWRMLARRQVVCDGSRGGASDGAGPPVPQRTGRPTMSSGFPTWIAARRGLMMRDAATMAMRWPRSCTENARGCWTPGTGAEGPMPKPWKSP